MKKNKKCPFGELRLLKPSGQVVIIEAVFAEKRCRYLNFREACFSENISK
ncbi:MAG: hypothetical protein ACYTFY_12100 [Planctomycetota bacterium]|jgi:hypothetical protein